MQRRCRHFKSGQAKWLFRKRERQGLVESLHTMPTRRARLRSSTASSGMHCIASSCTSYTHVYLATCGCWCSPVGPCRAPNQPAKEWEWLREMCTCRAKVSLCGIPGPIASSSDFSAVNRNTFRTGKKWHWKSCSPAQPSTLTLPMP